MMKWLVVQENGNELLFEELPERNISKVKGYGRWTSKHIKDYPLPKGSIEHLIGKKLTWEDEPFEFPEDFYIKNK